MTNIFCYFVPGVQSITVDGRCLKVKESCIQDMIFDRQLRKWEEKYNDI